MKRLARNGWRVLKRARGWLLGMAGLSVVLGLLLVAAAWWLPLPAGLERPHAQLVLDKDGAALRAFATRDETRTWRIPVRRDELPDDLVDAVLSFEDQRFYSHFGVDPIALARAMVSNVAAMRVVSGASTLTMQVARMLENRPRTLGSKLIETFRAVQLELRFEKDEILTHYLNLAPYGGNIEGIGAAAYLYYGKPVAKLTLDEAATLAAVPNNPNLYRPGRESRRAALTRRRNDVLERMKNRGVIRAIDYEAASSLPVHAKRRAAPFSAPHLSELLHSKHFDAPRIESTIDAELQHRAEKLLAAHTARTRSQGIVNGAVVVIENETGAVRAYVGSQSFFDVGTSGQVDGVRALRSPGSTLKPFVYAMAFDRRVVGMHTLLADIPITYGDWSPLNFDGEFRGVVSAKDALASSLNVPAVLLARRLEPDGLITLLHRAGFRAFQKNANRFGLATVLGGCDVSLLELTNLYAALARGGEFFRASFTKGELTERPEPVRLFSEASSYMVSEILTDVRRPELPDLWKESVSLPRIAWKTGTSYGRRDAWSIGYNRRYTVGVWVGNFDSSGAPELVGVQAAAPLLFSMARVLPGSTSDRWIDRPKSLVSREVCALSGALATPACPHARGELAIKDGAPVVRCEHHVSMDIDDDSGERLCSRCREGRHYHSHVHVVWPGEVAAYLVKNGGAIDPVPEHNPRCESGLSGEGPVIHSPQSGDHFVLRNGVPREHQQIAMLASAQSGAGTMFWFVDEALYWSGRPGETVMLDPTPGQHRLTAVDQEGRSTSLSIFVE